MKQVIIYSTETCPYCVRARDLLKSKDVSYTDIRVDEQPELRDDMISKSGRRTVPQIFIGDEHVGGCDDLFALEQAGELDSLLSDDSKE